MLTSANTAANATLSSMRALLLTVITLALVACGGSYDDGTSSGEDGLSLVEPATEHCWGPVEWVEGSYLYVYSMDPEKLVWESVAPEHTVCLDIPRPLLCMYQGSEPGPNDSPPADMRSWEGNAPECAPGVE